MITEIEKISTQKTWTLPSRGIKNTNCQLNIFETIKKKKKNEAKKNKTFVWKRDEN